MICDKIRLLRESAGMTQTELSKKLGISRSGVNAWEMGLSIPSTQCIVELALLFDVSSDYLLGLDGTSTVSVSGLSEREISDVVQIIECIRGKHR